jgi:hypothetical protein
MDNHLIRTATIFLSPSSRRCGFKWEALRDTPFSLLLIPPPSLSTPPSNYLTGGHLLPGNLPLLPNFQRSSFPSSTTRTVPTTIPACHPTWLRRLPHLLPLSITSATPSDPTLRLQLQRSSVRQLFRQPAGQPRSQFLPTPRLKIDPFPKSKPQMR